MLAKTESSKEVEKVESSSIKANTALTDGNNLMIGPVFEQNQWFN